MRIDIGREKILIFVISLVVLAIGAFLLGRNASWFEKGENSYIASGILYNTTLAQNEAEKLSEFLKVSLKESYVPEELNLVSTVNKDNAEEFRGTWLAEDNKPLSVLYVFSKKERVPLYMRVWRIEEKPELNYQMAITLSEEIFNEEFLGKVGESGCRERTFKDNPPIMECTKMQRQENGEIVGITLRSPVLIEELGVEGTAVSACLVPKESSATYIAPICI